MEAPEPLSIESFSYRWLVNLKPSVETPGSSFRKLLGDAPDEASFIEMDPTMPPSKRFSVTSFSHDFKFDFPISQLPLTIVHADELFAEGHVLPLFSDPSRTNHFEYKTSDPTLSQENDSQHAAKEVVAPDSSSTSASSAVRCERLHKQILQKYLNFLKPFYRIFQRRRSSFKAEFREKRAPAMRNWVYPEESPSSSPRISTAFSADDGRMSSFSECSIYEAVLHCKRSIGREMN